MPAQVAENQSQGIVTALAAAPTQAAATQAAQKTQIQAGPGKATPATQASEAIDAGKPATPLSMLAKAFNNTAAASDMKLVMAGEAKEVHLDLASVEAPKAVSAKVFGEGRQEGLTMPSSGFALPDGQFIRAEAPLQSAPARAMLAPPPVRQLAPVVVSLALGRGDEALTIALDPVELGRVEVSIGQGKDAGQVRIVAERPETLALLQRDQRELDRALNQSGLGDMARSLSFSLASDQQRQQHHGFAQERGQRASMIISGVEADRAMQALPAPLRNPNALIDIAV
ncbi:MAG: flagellar hook-length control protein FliK [Roseomonas sp.]|nr:flagellar hook-length control protein FliK [Roseomonas sp.]